MQELVRRLLTGAKRDDEVYTVLRVAVRAGAVTADEASTIGAASGIDYLNWHGDGVPGDRG